MQPCITPAYIFYFTHAVIVTYLHPLLCCLGASLLQPYTLFTFVYINIALVHLCTCSLTCAAILYLELFPQEVAVFSGSNVSFTCETQCSYQWWNVTPHISSVQDSVNSHQHTIHINGVENNTTVHCYCLWPHSELVEEYFIYVQGMYILQSEG